MNVLAHVIRGGVSESRHTGYVVVADTEGRALFTSGSLAEDRVSFLRSAAKPLQALPLVESGAADHFELTPAEIALTCASHNGEPRHVEQVQAMLNKGGLKPEQLLCGSHYPYFPPAEREMYHTGQKPTNLHSNCSGKHTGMLLACLHNGWSTDDYTEPYHPLQKRILQVVSEFTGVPPDQIATGVDGCSVVCFGVTTLQMATAFARLARPGYWQEHGLPERAASVSRLTSAMWQYPFNVAGTERADTDLMEIAPLGRVFSKVGAEAVWCLGFPEKGWGVAMKIEDGASRPEPVILAEILRQTGLLAETEILAFEERQVKPLRNVRNKVVGHHLATLKLRRPTDW